MDKLGGWICLCAFVGTYLLTSFVYAQPSSSDYQSCPACSSTPSMLASYNRFVQDVITIISNEQMTASEMFVASLLGSSSEITQQRQQDIKSQLDWIRGLNMRARRQSGIFTQTAQGLSDATRKTKQFMDAILFITKTFTLSNPGLGRSVLFQPASIRRDRTMLLDLDDRLQMLYLDIAREGNLRNGLDPRQRLQLLALQDKYGGEEGFLVPGTMVIMEKTTYADIVKALRKVNASFKRFVSLGLLVEMMTDDVKDIEAGGFHFALNRANALILRDDYACTRQIGMCRGTRSTFGTTMKAITEDFGNSAKMSQTQIHESIIALTYALKGVRYQQSISSSQCKRSIDMETGREVWIDSGDEDSIVYTLYSVGPGITKPYWTKGSLYSSRESHQVIAEKDVRRECQLTSWELAANPDDTAMMTNFLERERGLLQSQYGIYVNQARVDTSIWGIPKRLQDSLQTNRERSVRRQQVGTEFDSFEEKNQEIIGQMTIHDQKSVMRELQTQSYDLDFSKVIALQDLESSLRSALFQTEREHIAMMNQTINADMRPTLQLIATMTQQIRYMTTINGDRQQSNSMINLLGQACEMQCGNLGGVCWSE